MRWLALLAMLVLGLGLGLGACSNDLEPTAADLKARWDAQNVYPAHYKNDILALMRTWLNDPEHVRSAAVAPPQLKRVGPGDRFVACLRYDARGGDGHYAGIKTGAAIYVSGKLDSFMDTPKAKVQALCQDAAFAAFPELEKLKR